jgi:hypothetical protein
VATEFSKIDQFFKFSVVDADDDQGLNTDLLGEAEISLMAMSTKGIQTRCELFDKDGKQIKDAFLLVTPGGETIEQQRAAARGEAVPTEISISCRYVLFVC